MLKPFAPVIREDLQASAASDNTVPPLKKGVILQLWSWNTDDVHGFHVADVNNRFTPEA